MSQPNKHRMRLKPMLCTAAPTVPRLTFALISVQCGTSGLYTPDLRALYTRPLGFISPTSGPYTADIWALYVRPLGCIHPTSGFIHSPSGLYTSDLWALYVRPLGFIRPTSGLYTPALCSGAVTGAMSANTVSHSGRLLTPTAGTVLSCPPDDLCTGHRHRQVKSPGFCFLLVTLEGTKPGFSAIFVVSGVIRYFPYLVLLRFLEQIWHAQDNNNVLESCVYNITTDAAVARALNGHTLLQSSIRHYQTQTNSTANPITELHSPHAKRGPRMSTGLPQPDHISS